MNPDRLKSAYHKLQLLDERLTYRVRAGRPSLHSPGLPELDDRLRLLSEYTIELKEIVNELILALGTRPKSPS
jgi:hypothetical protein